VVAAPGALEQPAERVVAAEYNSRPPKRRG